jgi:molybdopterin synthase sulfur carrier subunit
MEILIMAIEVRIPTILRTYTGGAKAVEGAGDTIASLLTDLDAKHPGLRGRLITTEGGLHRFVNVYVNDEDVRFLGALDAKLSDGDTVTILPAVAGGAFGFAALAALRGINTVAAEPVAAEPVAAEPVATEPVVTARRS